MSGMRIPRRPRFWAGGTAIAAAGLLLLTGPDGWAQPPKGGRVTTAEGVVKEYTTAPRGEIDGAVLDDGTTLHWPPHLADKFQGVATKGDKVRATGWTETGPAGDTHFEVGQVTNLRTKASATNDDRPPAPPPPPPPLPPVVPAPGQDNAAEGVVKEFTTAPRGEMDGVILDNGTVLHWPPHLADRFSGIAAKGDRVRATGRTETGPAGDTHFEVQQLTKVGNTPAARSADLERRVRDLEAQVEQLRREIERLRRQK